MLYKNGSTYEGGWHNNVREGVGFQTFLNGDTYEGQWKDDDFEGKGVFVHNDRSYELDGLWKKGICTRGQLRSDKYKGGWENGRRAG